MVVKIIDKFSSVWKVYYIDWYIILKNFLKYHFNWLWSPDKRSKNNQYKAIVSEMQKLPLDVLNKLIEISEEARDVAKQSWLFSLKTDPTKGIVPLPSPLPSPLSSVWPDDPAKKHIILSEQDIKNQIKQIYTEEIVNNNIPKYRLLLLFIMKWYNLKIDKKNCDKFFSDMIDKSHRYGYSWEWFADRDTLLLKAKEMYEWAEWWREIKNHMSTLNKFLSPNPKK